jgi:hypothetical protein
MKGKPWSVEEEKQLRELVLAHRPLGVIVGSLGKTKESIRCKMARMGLVDDNQPKSKRLLSTKLTLPEELPSVEKALQKLNNALVSLETPGLDQAETLRLRSIIQGVKMYIEKFAEFLNYRELETRLIELERKYAALTKKAKNS